MSTYDTAVETEVMNLEIPEITEVAVAYDFKIDGSPSQTTVVGFNDDEYMYFFEFIGLTTKISHPMAKILQKS